MKILDISRRWNVMLYFITISIRYTATLVFLHVHQYTEDEGRDIPVNSRIRNGRSNVPHSMYCNRLIRLYLVLMQNLFLLRFPNKSKLQHRLDSFFFYDIL